MYYLRTSSFLPVILLSLIVGLLLPIAAEEVEKQTRFGRLLHLSDILSLTQHATTVIQDSDGFYWLGTQHGLYRYDGTELRHFKADAMQRTSLSADWITTLLVDQQGLLWIGTRYGGVNRFDPNTERFERIAVGSGLDGSKMNIAKIYQDSSGGVWVSGYGEGLFIWSESAQELELFQLPAAIDGVSTAFITDILVTDQSSLWLTVGDAPLRSKAQAIGGLIHWQTESRTGQGWHSGNSALRGDSFTRVISQDSNLLLGSFEGGVWFFDKTTQQLQALPQPAALLSAQITDLVVDQHGHLWVSSYNNGLWQKPTDNAQWQHFPANPEVSFSVRSNSLHQLFLDQQNALWLVAPSGFSIFGEIARQIKVLPSASGQHQLLPGPNVLGISVLRLDSVWLANREAGVVEFNYLSGATRHFPLPVLATGPTLARSVYAEEGLVWVGTDRGLFQLDPQSGHWRLHSVLPEQDHLISVGVIIADPQQRLWLGSRGKGVLLLDADRKLQQHFAPGQAVDLPFSSVSTLLYDQQGHLWVGSPDSGLWRWSEEDGTTTYWLQSDDSRHGLLFNGIQMLYEENQQLWVRAGNLNHRWLGPQPLGRTEFKSYQPMEKDDSLIAAKWFRLLYRQLWLPELDTSIELGALHGMQEATWIGSWAEFDGLLFRGGSQGMDVYRPDDLPKKLVYPEVRLTSFSLFNQQQQPGGEVLPRSITRLDQLTLNYEQDMFSLRFSTADLILASQWEYRYRLRGFDRDWLHAAHQERLATYTRIPPGDYVFEVAVRLQHGEWQAPVSVAVQILPPWWMTWWFRSLMMALLVFSIWGLLNYKIRSERVMRQHLQRQVDERTHELKEKHDALQISNQDLMLLQQIGREINASLDLEQVLSRCHQILSALIDVHVMVIGLQRPSKQEIEFIFWLENGVKAPSFSVAANDTTILASLCFQRKQEIHVDQRSDFFNYFTTMPKPLHGEPMQSVLYIPLLVNQQAVGVFSVQSPQAGAYSESQLDLLRTLANSIVIAVVNADTYTRLQQTQQQLVTQEKMASLGGLVAGVAHEINTPLGICVTATSHLKVEYEQVQQSVINKELRQSQFDRFLQHLAEGLKILEVNTERAAALVQSFKQVSVDQSNDSLRDIDVADYLQDVMLSLQPQLRKQRCQFDLECAESIHWTTDAGALAQIVTNLVMNSLKHAFANTAEPHINIGIVVIGKELHLSYRDNGCGMTEHDLKRLFEPFYTTKRALGGTGLGAHIVYNLITVRMKGQISVSSEPDQGLHYQIIMPMDAC